MPSVLRLIGLVVPVPDFPTLCRRAQSLQIAPGIRPGAGPVTLIVGSTGLRFHNGRDWMQEKHRLAKVRKSWRKLHIGLAPSSGEIVASHLTTGQIGDPDALPDLTGQDVELIIPPQGNAVPGDCRLRNAHIDVIAGHGPIDRQNTG
ncbi:transposase [Paracoccus sp. (in: a-proteobacteria)]|uniref:transposase n=1 Tax=Paracoccus sp. TaxID=267 RepID=UPI003A877B65